METEISKSRFKTHALEIFRSVEQTGESVIVTDHVKAGKNILGVRVLRYCAGTYLEDQDYWQMSGLQRDVFLFS